MDIIIQAPVHLMRGLTPFIAWDTTRQSLYSFA